MKYDKTIGLIIILLLFTVAVFTVPSASAYNEETVKKADEYYMMGFKAFNMGEWANAARNFKKSFDYIPHSMTAYMLSVTSLKMELPKQALNYADTAFSRKPALEEPYSSALKEIAVWAASAENDPYYRIKGKADDPFNDNKPTHPAQRPPGPAIPDPVSVLKSPLAVAVIKPVIRGDLILISNFTGTWRCTDGGIYFIRQTGDELWWYGQSPDGGKSWANVFHGRIHENQIIGKWADVPRGKTLNSGKISLEVVGSNKLRAVHRTGGFSGNEWIR